MKPTNFQQFVGLIVDLISAILPVIASMALLVFVWGLVRFVLKAGDEKAVQEGKNLMKWGLIALFVMVSFLSIVSFLHNDIGFGPLFYPLLPGLK